MSESPVDYNPRGMVTEEQVRTLINAIDAGMQQLIHEGPKKTTAEWVGENIQELRRLANILSFRDVE